MTSSNAPRQGIVLFAHGSRDPQWHLPIDAVAQQIRLLQPDRPVRCAYLELSTPDLASACQELVGLGLTALVVVPLFLGIGRHAREDLPRQMAALRTQYPKVDIALQPAIGENPQLIRLLAQIACGTMQELNNK